jgi:quinol monooxygenase YgiN
MCQRAAAIRPYRTSLGPLTPDGLPTRDASTATLRAVALVNAGTLGTVPGRRDELIKTLTQRSDLLRELGCNTYEVGVNDDDPETVFVVEIWESQEEHRRSLDHPQVQASIAAARPILSGDFGGFRFDVVGSPLRDD